MEFHILKVNYSNWQSCGFADVCKQLYKQTLPAFKIKCSLLEGYRDLPVVLLSLAYIAVRKTQLVIYNQK